MGLGAWAAVMVGILALCGTVFAAIKSSKTSLERINYQNAKEINDQYTALNATYIADAIVNKTRFEALELQLKKVMKEFRIREEYLEGEIETHLDTIKRLETENIILRKENEILKDSQEKHSL